MKNLLSLIYLGHLYLTYKKHAIIKSDKKQESLSVLHNLGEQKIYI